MARLTWSHAAHVRASPDEVYAWMTDYGPDDHASEAYRRGAGVKEGDRRKAVRKVLARRADEVELEDTWGHDTFRTRVALDRAARAVTIHGDWGYRATWRAVPERGGTRVVAEGAMEPRGLFALLLPLVAKKLQKQTADDFRGHVADLEATLGKPQA